MLLGFRYLPKIYIFVSMYPFSTPLNCKWCHNEESNPGPEVYKTPALPSELLRPYPSLRISTKELNLNPTESL